MKRQERLKAIAKVNASMPSDISGPPDEREIAILDKMLEMNLIQVEETK
jgi:hypothetical protein